MVATSCFKYMGYNIFFNFTIDVLNLKLRFATDVLMERSGSLSEPGSIFMLRAESFRDKEIITLRKNYETGTFHASSL